MGSCEFSSSFLGLLPMVAFHVVHSWGTLALCALDAMRAPLRWLLLYQLSWSALASHTLGSAISWVSCRFETSKGWVLYIQEAHFYHHWVLLTHKAHFIIIGSYSFTRPISIKSWVLLLHKAHFYQSWVLLLHEAHSLSSSGLTHLRGPFLIIIWFYSFARPISIIIESYSFTRPISANPGSYSFTRPNSTNPGSYSFTRPSSTNPGSYFFTRPSSTNIRVL